VETIFIFKQDSKTLPIFEIRTAEVVDESENLVIQRQTELMVYKLTETGNSWTTRALLKRNLITPEPEKSSCIFGYLFRSHNKMVLFVAFDSEFHCLCPETGLLDLTLLM